MPVQCYKNELEALPEGMWQVKKTGCWFRSGKDLTGALHVLQFPPPPPSILAPVKSTMETFWYPLTQVALENGC